MKRIFSIPWDKRAYFIKRPNRFLALCQIEGENCQAKVHVRDPGRLTELLFDGNELLVKKILKPGRKTKWDLIAARSINGDSWVLVNSGFHSQIAKTIFLDESLSPFKNIKNIRSEIKLKNSRLDFLITLKNDEKIYIEVKGCTLQRGNMALFPDAPTLRGARHLEELLEIVRSGVRAAVVFLIFCPDVSCFKTNEERDKNFSMIFKSAIKYGVDVYCFLLEYKEDFNIYYKDQLPLCKK